MHYVHDGVGLSIRAHKRSWHHTTVMHVQFSDNHQATKGKLQLQVTCIYRLVNLSYFFLEKNDEAISDCVVETYVRRAVIPEWESLLSSSVSGTTGVYRPAPPLLPLKTANISLYYTSLCICSPRYSPPPSPWWHRVVRLCCVVV